MTSSPFSANLGGADRGIRAILGVALLALVFTGPRSLWGLVGLVPLATAAIGWCPLYLPFGISTCTPKQAPRTPAR